MLTPRSYSDLSSQPQTVIRPACPEITRQMTSVIEIQKDNSTNLVINILPINYCSGNFKGDVIFLMNRAVCRLYVSNVCLGIV